MKKTVKEKLIELGIKEKDADKMIKRLRERIRFKKALKILREVKE